MLGDTKGKEINSAIKDYVVFDLETTGLSNVKDEVVEISAVKVVDGQVVDEFTSLVNPQISIPYNASMVNGITNEMVDDAPFFDEVLQEFIDFIGDMVLVGHNISSFDLKFIYRDCDKYYGKVIDNDYLDTLKMARNCLPELTKHSLGSLAEYYSISTEGAHRALFDCHMNQKVFEYLKQEKTPEKLALRGMKICPKCGNILKKRNGKYGEFYGCSGFPDCRYTENIHS